MSLNLDIPHCRDEGVIEAYEAASLCGIAAKHAFDAIRVCEKPGVAGGAFLKKNALKALLALQRVMREFEDTLETMMAQFALVGQPFKVGEVAASSAHAAAFKVGEWTLGEANWAAQTGLRYPLHLADWRAIRKNWPAVVAHFAGKPPLDIAELASALQSEAFRLDDKRRREGQAIGVGTEIRQLTEPLPQKGQPGAESATVGKQRQNAMGGGKTAGTKGKRIDERMLASIRDNQDAMYWSANQWNEHLGCAKSTVVESKTWKQTCKPARERERLSRGHRLRQPKKRRSKPKGNDADA